MPIEADYIALGDDRTPERRFAVLHWPQQGVVPRGLVVHAPAFAEEMNKSRRCVSVQARRLASAGLAVALVDPKGCGDSPFDFGDATWQDWVRDIAGAMVWMQREFAQRWPDRAEPVRILWGLRAGALLADAAARMLPVPCDQLYWQPTARGSSTLQQFLRLLSAADLAGGRGSGRAAAARTALASGEVQEVAGYRLNPSLAAGLDAAALAAAPLPSRLVVLEVTSRVDASPSPANIGLLGRWTDAGFSASAQCVNGPAFWQSTEIEDAPDLWDATDRALHMLCEGHASTARLA